jgi:hypothetical protein
MSMTAPQSIAEWLAKLGLGQYTQRFADLLQKVSEFAV